MRFQLSSEAQGIIKHIGGPDAHRVQNCPIITLLPASPPAVRETWHQHSFSPLVALSFAWATSQETCSRYTEPRHTACNGCRFVFRHTLCITLLCTGDCWWICADSESACAVWGESNEATWGAVPWSSQCFTHVLWCEAKIKVPL